MPVVIFALVGLVLVATIGYLICHNRRLKKLVRDLEEKYNVDKEKKGSNNMYKD